MTDKDDDFLIPKKRAAQRLGKSVSTFDRYRKKHEEKFPIALKEGKHKQSPVAFSNSKITAWLVMMQEGKV
ncbi:MAG: hypothetical protein V4730_02155 [Pseudomonadota bacterium]